MSAVSSPDRYVVIGNPIAHSKSPFIHRLFAEQTGQRMEYSTLLAEPGRFAAALDEFQHAGGKGANVTVPFKEDAWRAVNELSPRAEVARAVNTIAIRADGRRFGDNTDGIGLLRDLEQNKGVMLADRRILILGAGGAVRGVLQPLVQQGPRRLAVVNRTAERARELAGYFQGLGHSVFWGGGFDELDPAPYDVVINGTAASLKGELPPLDPRCLGPATVCYDMMYGSEDTLFMSWARARNVAGVFDGLGMLVEQAAEAFFIWRAVRPQTTDVITKLRAHIGQR